MIDLMQLDRNIKGGKIDNCYVFVGIDENLIKESISAITERALGGGNLDFNLFKFDGEKVEEDEIINACETMPFMSEKKVVIVYRANFLKDSEKSRESVYKRINGYLSNPNPQTILLMYYVFDNSREKESRKIKNLDKKVTVVKVDKLKGAILQKKVKDIFHGKGKEIQRNELTFFCNMVENNMEIIKNEIDKLVNYTEGREITKEDIVELLPSKNENDIFNLVDLLSQKKVKVAIDIYNELIFKGEKATNILRMIQRQYDLLLMIKVHLEHGKSHEVIAKELSLHPYICEKMMTQSRKFSKEGLMKILELSLKTEKRIKTLSTDQDTELEMFMIDTLRVN